MTKKKYKTYLFSIISSLWISLILTLSAGGLFYFFKIDYPQSLLALFWATAFVVSVVIIQFRVEKYIYKQVKKIYDEVSLLENTSIKPDQITTDMAALTREVERYAEDRKIEIEALKVREAYRKEFIGNISHELKTPLFTVQGYILTLLDGAMKDKSVRKKYLQRAAKGVERLIYIVKDLDMITKFEAGGMKLVKERFNIIELIQNVFDLLEMRAARKHISLVFDKKYSQSIFVEADRERIQQVLTNLVMNSIKYGEENGTTEVSVEDLTKNKIIVRITDNGEGISEENLPRIFERFYRVDKSGSRREGGSGLGLSIVKHIVEAHNEKIYVESRPEIGSEFSFTLEKSKK